MELNHEFYFSCRFQVLISYVYIMYYLLYRYIKYALSSTYIGGKEQGTGWQMGGESLIDPSSRHLSDEAPSRVNPSSQEKLMMSPTLSSLPARDAAPCSNTASASHVTSAHDGLSPDQEPLPRHVCTRRPLSV